ncbi:MAG: alkane 1-monooxygenase [Bacteroidota bacterium]
MTKQIIRMKDLKYLAAYTLPILAWAGMYFQGVWTFATVMFAFVAIPLLEPLLGNSAENYEKDVHDERKVRRIFDWLLYINIPIVYGTVIGLAYCLNTAELATWEIVGLVFSSGIVFGSNGINVAHELGHRRKRSERILSKILLIPELYAHFYIEHNRGHHKHVATDKDPASARLNEWLYTFYFRSLIGSYISAWKIEMKQLSLKKIPFWSWKNEMLRLQLFQALYVIALFVLLPWEVASLVLLSGFIGALLLETINYIEHYGLRRKKLESGGYERVRPRHSWNANFEMGRIVLYELTRHSDHHFIAAKKYQNLDHYEEAPQLPVGYPTSMLMAMVPPLWFAVMNPRIPKEQLALA